MPMKLYDTREAVPDAQRTTAIETKDGKFAVAEEDEALRESGKDALEKERKAARDAKAALKIAEEKAAILERDAEAHKRGITSDELQKIKDAEALARKPIEDERDTLKKENRKLKLTDRVKALALANGVMPDRIMKAMKDLDGRVDLTEGGDTIVVKDASGTVTLESIEDFLKTTYKKEAPFFYAGPGGSGSGAESGGGGGEGDGAEAARAAGKAQAEKQKATRDTNKLAFT